MNLLAAFRFAAIPPLPYMTETSGSNDPYLVCGVRPTEPLDHGDFIIYPVLGNTVVGTSTAGYDMYEVVSPGLWMGTTIGGQVVCTTIPCGFPTDGASIKGGKRRLIVSQANDLGFDRAGVLHDWLCALGLPSVFTTSVFHQQTLPFIRGGWLASFLYHKIMDPVLDVVSAMYSEALFAEKPNQQTSMAILLQQTDPYLRGLRSFSSDLLLLRSDVKIPRLAQPLIPPTARII